MCRAAVLGAVVVFVLGALFVVRPFMAAQRDQPAEIPSPASLVSTDVVPVAPGHPVCFDHAVAERHSEWIRFKVASPAGPAPALAVHLKGPPSYDYTAQVPPGTLDGQMVQASIPAPLADVPVRVCIRNRGKQPVALFASNDRTRSRSHAIIDGEDTNKSVWFAFYEPVPRAITERLPDTIERMTVFRPQWVGRPLLWAIALLFLVGMPIAVVWAYVRALREDELGGRSDIAEIDVNQRRSWWRRFVG